MNTSTRFRNLVKKMVLQLAVGCVMSATGAFAQSGDIIGFYSSAKDSTYTAPGATVQFTIRLYGTIVVSNLFNTAFVQPQVRMEVGSDGASSSAYATLVSSAWTGTPFDPFNRTDLTFAYTIRPGDMADPMKIFGIPATGFTILNNQCWIYKAYPGGVWSNVTWKVNTLLYDEPGANRLDSSNPSGTIVYGDVDMSYQNIVLRTLSYDPANSPNTLVARAPARTWRIQSGGTNAVPVKVWVWTPHTNVLQIGTSPGLPLEVTIPAGVDYVDFPIKGLATNAIPTIATVYAQRPSDYAKNGTAVTNFITRDVTITPAGAPTISLEFSNGGESQTLSETNDLDTGSFQIVLSEASTNRVYVDFTIAHQPSTLTNVIITPQPGGYYVEAGQEKSDPYYFSVVNGTRESARAPYVRITPAATNTAIYTIARPGILNIPNVAPSVLWYPPATGDENNPVTFDWSDLIDVDADIARGITFRWNFGDSAPVVQTNFTTFGQITHTYAGIGDVPRNYTVTLTITDADGGSYTLPAHTITITPAPKPANVSIAVNRDDLIYQEGDTTARYRVVLSAPALQNTMVSLVAQYVVDGTSADACLGLSVTNNIIIPTGLTSSVPFTMSIKDGTTQTTSGILIIPTITNAAALVQYPGAYSGIVIIENVAPGIDTVPTCLPTTSAVAPYNAIELGKPFTFRYTATDITADVAGAPPITVEFQFQDGVSYTNTGVNGTVTHTFSALGGQSVTMIATDKDGGQRTVTFPITIVPPLPPPSITVFDYPVFIAENDSTSAKQLTIQLSQAPITTGLTNPVVVFLDVTPVNSAVNGAITIPASVTFYSAQTTKTVNFTVQDGTVASATSGFLVTPRIAVGAPGDSVYVQREPGNILVQNVAPQIIQPIDGSTNVVATVGQSRTFTWSVRDVAADLPTMSLVWDWGDGSTDTTIGGSGSITHTYMSAAAQLSVSVTATDKDGDYSIITFYVSVKDSKQIIALPIGPNTAGFNGLTYLGEGHVSAPQAAPALWDTTNLLHTFYFSADALSAQLIATPTNIPNPAVFGRKSYFFAWDGPLAAFQNPAHVTQPLAPSSTIINMPTGTAGGSSGSTGGTTINGNLVQVSAIFTLEFNPLDTEDPAGVNNGDLNQDGIPDRLVQRYFVDPTATGSGGGTQTTLNQVWFQNLGGFNDDEDYLPVYPTGDNQGVLDFRPVANPRTAQGDVAVNAFTAFMEVRGWDGILGTLDDSETDPTENDTDNDGYPDGWEYWFWYESNFNGRVGSRYNPFNVAQGDLIAYSEIVEAFYPLLPRSTYSDPLYRDDFDNDGLLDVEEMVVGSDPTNWDGDGDMMADGWEINNGFNPRDVRDGSLRSDWGRGTNYDNNPDADYFAISTGPRVHIQIVTTNGGVNVFGDPTLTTVTNHYFVALDASNNVNMATLATAYRYGNDAEGPWAVGRPVPASVLTPPNFSSRLPDENLNPLIMHFQVRNEYLFDPRTAWSGAISGGGARAGWPYDASDRFGPSAPDTCPFTAVDEYLLLKFMYELQLNGMVSTNNSGWIARFQRAIDLYASNNNAIVFNNTRRILIQESWSRFTTHPRTPDTDATPGNADGIADGWELYIAVPPGAGGNVNDFTHSPWAAPDAANWEFWGVDSLAQYVNPNQYYFGMTNNNPMIGVVTIIRLVDDPDNYWTNKRWPTDPWNGDTDFDGVGDAGERAFMYGNAVSPGAGGGLNPCSVDTDRDALPDIWEIQYAGTPVDAEGNTSLPPLLPGQPEPYVAMTIENGQDGTVADAYKDADYDGLASYQEYMVQSLRCYRYDIPRSAIVNDAAVTDPVTGKMGQPMDISFEIGALFEPVTNLWDQAMFGWPTPFDILYWMRPAGGSYCSTDPNNPDTDYDNMDDYYEMFHGLNPLLGNGSRTDLLDDRVAWAYGAPPYPGPMMPPFAYNNNWYYPLGLGFTMDFVQYPWLNGMPSADPDADGLLNMEEMLAVNMPLPENQNTDPSPLWTTDPSNLESLTARFYPPFGYGWKARVANLYRDMYFWPAGMPPYFTWDFEMNEGYDTDNDGISDKDEQVTNRNAKSDPRDSEDPLRRQGIWFSGWNSAATTPYMYTDINTVVGQTFSDMEQAFRSFTVELWARPEWETNITEQILIERAFDYGQSDASQTPGEPRLRRNFLIGIAPDGRVFGGFDNAGGHDEHTDNVRLYGEKVISNKWVHLAIRMDGRTQKFTLFVNGVSQGERSTTLIPATGLDVSRYYPTVGEETEISAPRTGTLIIGAANNALVSLGIGIGFDPVTYYTPMAWAAEWSEYEKFYRGWIDEVRVWDGARSNQEIADNFRKPMTREEILANRTQILEELNNGAARNALSTNNFLSPILMNLYTFNNLFSAHAEQYVAQVPRGFNTAAVNTNRPARAPSGTIVNWWNQAQVKNAVYTNWHYLPWIENQLAHLPPVTTITDANSGEVVYVNDNFLQDTYYWTRRSAGNLLATNSFPNTSDPYGFLPSTKQCIDLLPIGDAWAKQCTDFWDDLGATGSWLENSGTLDDGLPLWWKTLHGTTGNWNDLYNGTNTYYVDNGMTNGEVYQRDLAKGMLPIATNTTDYATVYRQTADSNGDGMPDWWKRMYGLSVSDATGENGPLGDPDKDALSNYAEYLITEVYQLRYSNPLKFKTNPAQPVSDYFMKPGGAKLNFGAMFSDHDFVEGWWEELYSPTAANAYIFDSKTDYDDDGWSNWAEARYSQAVAPVRPDLREVVMVNGITAFEYPIPVVDTYISYKGVQTAGNLLIQAFSSSAMVGEPDAIWNITFGDNGVQQNTLPLGFFSDRVVRTRLSPGSVVPGTLAISLTDSWTGEESETGFDMNGVIYSSPTTGLQQPIGTINYVTGEMVLNLGHFKDMVVETGTAYDPLVRESYIDAMVSYFQMTYDTKLPNGWPQHIYLGRAATGALKEGKNYFFAFIDVDGNEAWDAGEPAGIPTPFETDIGWDENRLEIQLTDYTPYNLRLSLATGLRSEDVVFGMAGGGTTGGGGGATTTGGTYTRVRIRRAAVQTSSFSEAIVFDKVIYGRDYIHEGDIMTLPSHGGYGLDWNFGANGILTPLSVGAITYQVYVGDLATITNNTLLLTFTNKFDGARAIPVPVSPAHGAYVYSARPTFSWSLVSTNSGYSAFAFEIRRGSSTGPLVYPIETRSAPLKNTKTDNYVWEAPFFMGDKNTVNNGVYYWRVQAMSPRYSLTNNVASEWSPWRIFRWDVNSTLAPAGVATNVNGSSSGYGQLRTVVKYFGAVTNTVADRVILQAFKNRGFTGTPAAQYAYSASQNTILTNQSLSATNAISLRGLTPGVYYVRAFLDSNTNSVLDSWESWGYANYYGDTKAMYDVRPVQVSYSSLTPQVIVYIEDSDTDQDWFPDAYEYEQNRTLSNFLELTGPLDAWSYRGDSEINPNLDADAFIDMVFSMAMGSSAQQAEIIKLVSTDGQLVTPAKDPAVTIENLTVGAGGPNLTFDLTPGQPAQYSSTLFSSLFGGAVSAAPQTTYTYNVRFSDSLATPKSEWVIVKTGTVSVQNGETVKTVEPTNPVTGANGFFYVEIVK